MCRRLKNAWMISCKCVRGFRYAVRRFGFGRDVRFWMIIVVSWMKYRVLSFEKARLVSCNALSFFVVWEEVWERRGVGPWRFLVLCLLLALRFLPLLLLQCFCVRCWRFCSRIIAIEIVYAFFSEIYDNVKITLMISLSLLIFFPQFPPKISLILIA